MCKANYRQAVSIGICAAVLFVGAMTYRLDRAGLFYDELHQATGAFAYVGRPRTMFSVLPLRGFPLLNMTYSGAIKTALYGLYLRVSGRPFGIISWRLSGILLSVFGIVSLCVLAGDRIPTYALLLFLCLLLSDVNFLLQSRHDWGPVALAFLLRMLFIGTWLRSMGVPGKRASPMLLGLIVGIAIFEKLSSIVLLFPLAIILLAEPRTRSTRKIASAAIGAFFGALPVIAAHIYWLLVERQWPLLSSMSSPAQTLLEYAWNYLALGNGVAERQFEFTAATFHWAEWVETLAMGGFMIFAGLVAWSRTRIDNLAATAGIALISYGAIGVGLRWLPAPTAQNHWIIGTPFQYLAIAFAAASVWANQAPMKFMRVLCIGCLATLLLARAPSLVSAFEAIRDDRYTAEWDPSLNTAAIFAAGQPKDTVFIAADWGIATQVFCLSNGRQDFVFEPFWDYDGPATLRQILDYPRREFALLAAPRPRPLVRALATGRIYVDMAEMDGWEAVDLEPWVQKLPAVEIRAFRRTASR